jgi:predicted acylesterase/phospholipase RssA
MKPQVSSCLRGDALVSQLRLAVVFPGAASLGSYEAGAAFELARCALLARRLANDKPPLTIDVVVGSSAGAITGALLAYIILTDGEPSWLYHAWVTHPQLHELMLVSELNGVFSMRRLMEISRELLADVEPPHCPDDANLRYVAMLTNLSPLHYRIPILEDFGRPLLASTNRDWKAMVLTPRGALTPHGRYSWRYVASVALSSAAFPAVFPAQRLERGAMEYIANHVWLDASGSEVIMFDFIDGGVMHNCPIGIAFDALYEPHRIGLIDQEPIDDTDAKRLIVVISPRAQTPMPTKPAHGLQPLMVDVLMGVLSARFNVNDVFDDLRGAQKLNSRIKWKTILLERMKRWLLENPQVVDGFIEALEDVRAEVEKDLGRIRAQRFCSGEHDGHVDKDENESGWSAHSDVELAVDLLKAVLDKVSGTTGKRQVRIDLVSPSLLGDVGMPDELLCGEALGHFAGFLSRRFRENDFQVGAECVRKWLCELDELDDSLRESIGEEQRIIKVWGERIERRKDGSIIPIREREPLCEVKLGRVSKDEVCARCRWTPAMYVGMLMLAIRAVVVSLINVIRFMLRRI